MSTAKLILQGAAVFSMLLSTMSSFAQDKKQSRANIGLLYPLSSNWTHAASDTNNFSLNLIAGVSAAEHGVAFAGFSNIVRHNTKGLQMAGFSNHIGKNAAGAMFAGFLNTYGGGNALAAAGFANIASNSSGPQIAGFLNKGGNAKGPQLAGFVNIGRDVKGVQVAGFLNIAKKLKGVQLGFINIADSAGTQLGVINISKNGEKSLGITIDENQTTMLSFRSGGKLVYGIIGIGYNLENKRDKYAFEAGIGAHIVRVNAFRLNAELVNGALQSFKGGEYFKSSLRLMPALKITKSFEIFAGPSFNYINTNTVEGKGITDNYISRWTRNNGRDLHAFSFGYNAGLQVIF
jgi:hypothetical protein